MAKARNGSYPTQIELIVSKIPHRDTPGILHLISTKIEKGSVGADINVIYWDFMLIQKKAGLQSQSRGV